MRSFTYTDGSSWPLGHSQCKVILALSDAKAWSIGHVTTEGWIGLDLGNVIDNIENPASREAMHQCLDSLCRRGLVVKQLVGKRTQAYRLTPKGERVARELRRKEVA